MSSDTSCFAVIKLATNSIDLSPRPISEKFTILWSLWFFDSKFSTNRMNCPGFPKIRMSFRLITKSCARNSLPTRQLVSLVLLTASKSSEIYPCTNLGTRSSLEQSNSAELLIEASLLTLLLRFFVGMSGVSYDYRILMVCAAHVLLYDSRGVACCRPYLLRIVVFL